MFLGFIVDIVWADSCMMSLCQRLVSPMIHGMLVQIPLLLSVKYLKNYFYLTDCFVLRYVLFHC